MTLRLSPCQVSTLPTVKVRMIGHEQAPCRTQGKERFTFSFDSWLSSAIYSEGKKMHFPSNSFVTYTINVLRFVI